MFFSLILPPVLSLPQTTQFCQNQTPQQRLKEGEEAPPEEPPPPSSHLFRERG